MPQENILMNDSIVNNIAVGIDDKNIDYEKLQKVIKISCCDKFIEKLPNKDKTVVGYNGFKLSGGQNQRICIARSLYKNFDLLVMDEPTNSLDHDTENQLLENLFTVFKDKTIIIIIHKLDLISKFDKVLLMENGQILKFQNSKDVLEDEVFQRLANKIKKK